MRRCILVIFFAAVFVAFQIVQANAGLIVCNNSGMEISVAVGWPDGAAWNSRGWWNIKPRECDLPLTGPLVNRYYYYYARTDGLAWEGGDGGAWFCADHDERFSYSLLSDPPCAGYNFRRIDVGTAQEYTLTLNEAATDPKTAALNCSSEIPKGRDAFITCWTRQVATDKEKKILDCVKQTDTPASLAICASKNYISPDAAKVADCSLKYSENHSTAAFAQCVSKDHIGDTEAKLINCAIRNQGSYGAIGLCAAGTQLTPEQSRLYGCIANNFHDYRSAGMCIAGGALSQDQERIANCVMQNKGSYIQMGVCAAGNNLTSEQQVFAQCAISTGGQPYAFAGCVGSQLTLNELQKCLDDGIGGSGCFGDNNTAVKFVKNAWKDVTEGPGPSNDLLGRDGFAGRTLENARHDLEHGPGPTNDLTGGQGWTGQRLEDIRKSAPPPLNIGSVGGHRVCIPWC